MSRPWDNESSPLTDAEVRKIGDSPFINWSEMQKHARDVERRLRNAERLLETAWRMAKYYRDANGIKQIEEHLDASKEPR